VGVFLIIGVILSFVPMNFGNTTFNSFSGSISLGLDLSGGILAEYEATIPNETGAAAVPDSNAMDGTRARLQAMLVSQGFTDARVIIEQGNRLRVEVPDVDEPGELLRILGQPAQLEFEHNGNVILTGRNVVSASAGRDPQQGYVVHLRLDRPGSAAFAEATANVGDVIRIYTVVGGERNLVSAPSVSNQILTGNAVITGMPDLQTAQNVANQITAGQFEVELRQLTSAVIPPTLGEGALMYGLLAGLIGIILIMAFMIFFYKILGVMSALTVLGYTVFMLFFLAALPWVQLTLPGIAGILLSIGMSVDGNIIMFERIKDEYRNGKSVKSACHSGLKKGFWPVFDAEITTVIAAVVLLIFGTGPVQSFAITLLVGIVLAMFFNLVVLRKFVRWVLPINSTSAKLFGLKRGKEYSNLEADQTAEDVAAKENELERLKNIRRDEKKARRAAKKGGVVNETT